MASTTIRRLGPAVDDSARESLKAEYAAAIRDHPGLSKVDFCRRLGISPSTLRRALKLAELEGHDPAGPFVIWLAGDIGEESRVVARSRCEDGFLRTTVNAAYAARWPDEASARGFLDLHRRDQVGCNVSLGSFNPFVVRLDGPGEGGAA